MFAPQQLRLLEPAVSTELLESDDRLTFGEVFTRRWVVDLILDLVGYTPDRDLASLRIVEPACGSGAFLGPILERLLDSARRHGHALSLLTDAVRAFDLRVSNVELSRKKVTVSLLEAGVDPNGAVELAERWVTHDDFLLHPHKSGRVDFVVGNPPYIRLEDLTPELIDLYRAECSTMRGRADIYIGFFEKGFQLLCPGGRLGFICADRWMHNQYGAQLRAFISKSFAIDSVVTMHDVDTFEEDVAAYPAIVIARASRQGPVQVVEATEGFGAPDARSLQAWMDNDTKESVNGDNFTGQKVPDWFEGPDLWPTSSPGNLVILRQLEAQFAPLEDQMTGTRVGIGVATGCDDVFITKEAGDIEENRLLPLLVSDDIVEGHVTWHGSMLVNPWSEEGLVDLARYPGLCRYFESHAERMRSRFVARRRPEQWYRTIDRVQTNLLDQTRLVLPDIKADAHPVLDDGYHYPHHNLYHITSSTWDLEVLGGLLLSAIANLFVGAYCVKMRGGCFRFQAQYLRRIRVPSFNAIRNRDRKALATAFADRDVGAATAVACRLYGLEASAFSR